LRESLAVTQVNEILIALSRIALGNEVTSISPQLVVILNRASRLSDGEHG
jgi:hypothetical protein